jgi:peptidyl-prolyl cis-trans isomerase B (cyclophilin B)
MDKVVLFVVVVLVGVFGVLVASNQSTIKSDSAQNLSLFASGTPPVQQQQPSLEPTVLPTASVDEPPIATATAIIKTSKGNIELTLYGTDAPNTVKNFVNKAKSGYYKNLTFHRVEDWVIQGGDPKGNGTGGGNIMTEINSQPFVVGSLGVARGQDINISNDSQFFITKKDSSHLNNQYTNFGMVTKGMDVVEKIAIGDKILEITITKEE